MIEVKAPNQLPFGTLPVVFLSGSIEMGVAEKWQDKIVSRLQNISQLQELNFLVLNPRRDDWDSTWTQNVDNPKFREQVEWELSSMEVADIIPMYFDPATKSPITLLEFGLYARSGKLVVCCPEGFWKKGNVDVVCERYHVDTAENLTGLVAEVVGRLILKRVLARMGMKEGC